MLHKSFCSTFLISGDAVDEDSGEPGESDRGMVMLRYSDSDDDSDSTVVIIHATSSMLK